MDIILRNEESVRLNCNGTNAFDTFVNVECEKNQSDDLEHYNEFLGVTVYDMHQIFIVNKCRTIKTFIFKKCDKVFKSDLGFYSDGEILFTNSEFAE